MAVKVAAKVKQKLSSLLDLCANLEASAKKYEQAKKEAKEIMEQVGLTEFTTANDNQGVLTPGGRSDWDREKLEKLLGDKCEKYKKKINWFQLKVIAVESKEILRSVPLPTEAEKVAA